MRSGKGCSSVGARKYEGADLVLAQMLASGAGTSLKGGLGGLGAMIQEQEMGWL